MPFNFMQTYFVTVKDVLYKIDLDASFYIHVNTLKCLQKRK